MRGIGVKCSRDVSRVHPTSRSKVTQVRLQPPTPSALIKQLKMDRWMNEGEVWRRLEGRQRQ